MIIAWLRVTPWLAALLACLAASTAQAAPVSMTIEPATEVTPTGMTVWGSATADPGVLADDWTTAVQPVGGGPQQTISTTLNPAPGATRLRVPVTLGGLTPGTRYLVQMWAGVHDGAPPTATATITTASTGGLAPRNTSQPAVRPAVVDAYSPELVCAAGAWSGDGVISEPVVRWLLDDTVVEVAGALPDPDALLGPAGDGSTRIYWPSEADVGHKLSCQVTATSRYGTTTATSASIVVAPLSQPDPLPPVLPPGPAPSPPRAAPPTLTVGGSPQTAECIAAFAPPVGSTWQWLRDSQPIAGATGGRYTVTPQDIGHELACRLSTPDGLSSTSPARPVLEGAEQIHGDPPAAQMPMQAASTNARRTLRGSLHDSLQAGRILRFQIPAGRLTITWRAHGTLIGRAGHRQARRGTARVTVRLSDAGRWALTRGPLWVTATADFRSRTGARTVTSRRLLIGSLDGRLR